LLRWTVFPLGTPFRAPKDAHNHECARLVLEPGAARERLTEGMYVPKDQSDATGVLEAAFRATIACEPIEKKIREAVRSGRLQTRAGTDSAVPARELGVISADELALWQAKETLRKEVIKVDDFPQDFGRAEIMQKEAQSAPLKAKAA